MKSWCDLSWREKCKINDGDVNPYSYQCCSFRVKTKVEEGIVLKEKQKEKVS